MAFWGAPISAAGHAVVIGLALWGLPWLRARPEAPPPVMSVSLVTPDAFEHIARGASASAAPSPEPEPTPAPVSTDRPEATVPHPDAPPDVAMPDAAPPDSLAGDFDPAAPLGFPTLSTDAPVPGRAPDSPPDKKPSRRAPSAEASSLQGDAGEDAASAGAFADYGASVRAAVKRVQIYPKIARDRGLFGTARVTLTLAPDGRLESVRLVRSSGSKALDDASLAAVRNARMPMPPAGLASADLTYDLGLSFTLHDN